jgi:hypothetical protein
MGISLKARAPKTKLICDATHVIVAGQAQDFMARGIDICQKPSSLMQSQFVQDRCW